MIKNITRNMNGSRAALPAGFVEMDKGPMRDVFVNILTGNRQPAFGFDINAQGCKHYRYVEYGHFGVIVGSKHAMEVRVLLDNELLLETTLYPGDPPTDKSLDAQVRARMAEAPYPHFLTRNAKGKQFTFKAHPGNLTPKQIIAEQIHPGAVRQAPTMDQINGGKSATREEVRTDIDPADLPAFMRPAFNLPAVPTDADGSTAKAVPQLASAQANAPATGDPTGYAVEQSAQAAAPADAPAATTDKSLPPLDSVERSMSWAPSNGLVAVGVRMIQKLEENEPPRPPDGFTYILFQLNPWDLHCLALAHMQGQINLPSRDRMKEIMEQEGFGHEVPNTPHVVCGGNCHHKRR